MLLVVRAVIDAEAVIVLPLTAVTIVLAVMFGAVAPLATAVIICPTIISGFSSANVNVVALAIVAATLPVVEVVRVLTGI